MANICSLGVSQDGLHAVSRPALVTTRQTLPNSQSFTAENMKTLRIFSLSWPSDINLYDSDIQNYSSSCLNLYCRRQISELTVT